MLFRKRVDYLPAQPVALGGTLRWEIPRDFHIDAIYIRLQLTTTAGTPTTKLVDGVLGILKKVQIQVSDGARTRNVVDMSSMALLEYSRMILGCLRLSVAESNATPFNGLLYDFQIPIFFAHPQIADPLSSMFLLPAPRYNSNPVLTCQVASAADISTGGVAPTVTGTAKLENLVWADKGLDRRKRRTCRDEETT